MARQYLEEHEDLEIIGIGALGSADDMQEFVDEFGITFPTIVDENASLWPRFDVALQGAWSFVDDDGTSELIPYDLSGELLAEQLDALLAR